MFKKCTKCERSVVDQRVRLLFAEAHREFLSEPAHIEDEVEDQEDEVEDGRDCEECKVESKRCQTHKCMKHGWDDAH